MLSKTKIRNELMRLHEVLTSSFGHVKQDTQNIFEWINYLYNRTIQQDQTINYLNHQLSLMPKSREEIKQIIDQYYSYENFHKRIAELDTRVTSLVELQKSEIDAIKRSLSLMPNNEAILTKVHEIDERLSYIESRKKPSVKERIVKKITRNSKEYVKNVILSMLKKYGKATGLQLKEIVVDEQALCSKSSFYRLLEELENIDEVSVARTGKEKHYMYKVLRRA
ncbi:hypothetical protein KY361_00085 [Candidatus Woesearchaeota archaeon]|nr:hypothetical protein [Candidatus Woesearchaeota archaeon]